MAGTEDSLLTPRLRLVPIGPDNAADLWLLHNDNAVGLWYDCWRPSRHEADDHARRIAESWRLHGVTSGWHTTARPVRSSAAAACRGPRSTTTGPALHVPARCRGARRPANVEHRGDRPTVSLVFGWIVDHGLAPADAPFLRYETIDEPGGSVGLAQHAVGGFVDGAARGVVFPGAFAVYRLGRSRPAPAWGVVAGW